MKAILICMYITFDKSEIGDIFLSGLIFCVKDLTDQQVGRYLRSLQKYQYLIYNYLTFRKLSSSSL